ncbi:MAG: ABC transporter permease subunit [Pseudomonadota bacterium]
MAAVEYQEPGFRISQIWSDKRSRGVVIQIIALAALFGFLAFIVNNTINNLDQLGVETGYGFLWEPANYDINQRLIEYDSRSPHIRATVVGILNTVLVAFSGIVMATILGFIAGVLRLSHNFLINRIVYCYVEITRNVPLLLQILLWYGIIVHTLPVPKKALEPMSGVFVSNRGFAIPRPEFEPAFWAVFIAFVVAVVGAIVFKSWAKKNQEATGKIYPVFTINTAAIIGLPVIVFFLAGMPATLDFPALKGFNFKGGVTVRPEFMALWFALSVYTASFIAEIVRAGIQSVSHGQTEASYALGIKANWTMRLVILPQALRVIIPPLISQYLNLTKNSSLAIAVGYMDIVATIGGISLNQTGRALECMSIVLSLYLAFSLFISLIMNWYNKRVALVER